MLLSMSDLEIPLLRLISYLVVGFTATYPQAGVLNITSLSAYLRPSTDAPNFLIEVIRNSPTTLIFILDLPPRKDLVQHPDYLKTFYEEMQLDKQRQLPEKSNLPRPFTLMSPVAKRDRSGHGSPPAMAVPLFSAQFHTSILTQPLPSSRSFSVGKRLSCSSSSTSMEHHESKFKEFPYASVPHRELMVELVSTVENRLGESLLPCTLPSHVQYFENESATAHASLYVRSGNSSSQVDFILGSWVHCNLPTGGALNITSLSAYLRPSTDAPNFLIEVIRSSPTTLILILDLPPRKDLVQHPDYLKTFYEETQLDKQRQLLEKLPEVKPYFSSSLYIRSLVSPLAILVSIETEPSQAIRIDEIIQDHISPVAKVMLDTWLDLCACTERRLTDDESADLAKRDRIIKNKTIEIDLESSFPRLFGQEVANQVLGVLREIYNS
ncbi:hypothetical protein KY290_020128 [Solanum tuberosum]|uniref:Red chlorophyll catabolite reductase n=2 Tax=Solanum tuberosum TaxID=4113 RepID=A0ABQ7VJ21_SOLTU|nr:hypothetical protein KY284_016106 [Solanum tuberosum]KAH0704289.1 hypothetical protein KY285_018567 [Solanum tuberosum]KAH0764055.1 hypothetical protein KY290_020128 [Solanum tuberosum]